MTASPAAARSSSAMPSATRGWGIAGSALAAGQLVAQGRERLVRGERARRAVLVSGVAGGGGTSAAAGLAGLAAGAATLAAVLGLFGGLACLGHLAAVRLEPGA